LVSAAWTEGDSPARVVAARPAAPSVRKFLRLSFSHRFLGPQCSSLDRVWCVQRALRASHALVQVTEQRFIFLDTRELRVDRDLCRVQARSEL
jgi:hypothetical protein